MPYELLQPRPSGRERKRIAARIAALKERPWEQLTESQRLFLLTPEAQEFARKILGEMVLRGFDVKLGETWRSPQGQKEAFEKGRSGYSEPAWHSLGKAFHVIAIEPATGKLDTSAYPILGKIVRSHDGIWKGDVPLRNKYGGIYYDIAHVEYHPGVTLAQARKITRPV
jgi:hypothetical protein